MAYSLPLLVVLAALLLCACVLPPGGDTTVHHRAVHATGVATVTRRYHRDGEDRIDLLWQADNNIGDPVAFDGIALKTIAGLPQPEAVAAGDRLRLAVTHFILQQGSSTPVITQSRWMADLRAGAGAP